VVPTPDQSSIPDNQPSSIPSATPTIVPSQPPVTIGTGQPVIEPLSICYICGSEAQIANSAATIGGRICGDVWQEGVEGKISANECQVYQVSVSLLFQILSQ
jgi:hypothetical protein